MIVLAPPQLILSCIRQTDRAGGYGVGLKNGYVCTLLWFCSIPFFSKHILRANDVYESMEARRWGDLVVCSALFLPVCFSLSLSMSYPILVAPVV